MSEWPMMPLGEVLTADRRPLNPIAERSYTEVGVRSFGRGLFRKPSITGAELGTKRVFSIIPNRLVFNIVFAWEGAVARTTVAEEGTIASHRFPIFECVPDLADLDYMSYLFRSGFGLELMRRASPGSAGRNRTLSVAELQQGLVPIPPLNVQRQIAGWLQNTERRALDLMQLADYSSKVIVAARESILVRSHSEDSVSLRDLLTQREPDFQVMPDSRIVPAGIYSFGRGLFKRPAITGLDTQYSSMTTLREGDFVYSKIGAWEGGLAVVASDQLETVVSPEFPVFSVDASRLHPEYLRLVIRSREFVSQVRRLSAGTNARRHRVHPTVMTNIAISLPTMNVQNHVVEVARALESADEHGAKIRKVAKILLPAALNRVFGSLN